MTFYYAALNDSHYTKYAANCAILSFGGLGLPRLRLLAWPRPRVTTGFEATARCFSTNAAKAGVQNTQPDISVTSLGSLLLSWNQKKYVVACLFQNKYCFLTCLYSTVTNCAPQSHVSVSTVTLCAFSNRWIITSQRLHPNFHLGAAEGSSTSIPRSHSKQLDKPFEFIPCGHVGCVHELQPLMPFFISLNLKEYSVFLYI